MYTSSWDLLRKIDPRDDKFTSIRLNKEVKCYEELTCGEGEGEGQVKR